MCGRYYIPDEDSAAELQEIIDQINRKNPDSSPIKTGEIAPSDTAPVLANNRSMIVTPFAMKWGFTLSNGKLVFNTRSDTASEKPLFQDGMKQRRCLIPAAHYFEWEKRGREKIKYAIRPSNIELMYMAGIYRIESGKPVFSILTREPADSIAFIHDRMPVIMPKDVMYDWLNPKFKAEEILSASITTLDYTYAGNLQETIFRN